MGSLRCQGRQCLPSLRVRGGFGARDLSRGPGRAPRSCSPEAPGAPSPRRRTKVVETPARGGSGRSGRPVRRGALWLTLLGAGCVRATPAPSPPGPTAPAGRQPRDRPHPARFGPSRPHPGDRKGNEPSQIHVDGLGSRRRRAAAGRMAAGREAARGPQSPVNPGCQTHSPASGPSPEEDLSSRTSAP